MALLQGREPFDDLKIFLTSKHLPLESALNVASIKRWDYTLVESIVSRNDWKKLSFDERVSVAEESGWKYPFIKPLFSEEDITLEKMIEVLKRSNWNDVVVHIFILTKTWTSLPLEEAIEVALSNNLNDILIESVLKREDFK